MMPFEAAAETGALHDAQDILKERARSMNETAGKKTGFTPKVTVADPEESARFIVTALATTIWTLVCFFSGVAVGAVFF